MKFAILGAGAIGAYVGAALWNGGSDVTLIARGEHGRSMREHGVKVRSPRGDFDAHPFVTDDPRAITEADAVFVGLKAYSLPEFASVLTDCLCPGTEVIPAQNGIPWWYFQDHEGPLRDTVIESVDPGGALFHAVAADRILGCVVYSSTEIESPGVVRHIEGTRFALGRPNDRVDAKAEAVAAAFRAGGLKSSVEQGIRNQIWLKAVGNIAFNPVSALTHATLGELAQSPEIVKLLEAIFEESAEVAFALGAEFPVSLQRRLEAGLAVGDHKTSMLQDFEGGKPLEVDCLTGALIELANLVGKSVPHVRAIHACIKFADERRNVGRRSGPPMYGRES